MDGKSTYSSVRSVKKKKKNIINVYPNPATDHVIVSYSGNSRIVVQLFNSNGQQVSVTENNNGRQVLINLSSLNPGIYFVKITQDGNIETRKILKK